MTQPKVGFVGMTHLGLLSATAVASKGFETVCYDSNSDLIAKLMLGTLPVLEPGLPELLAKNGSAQQFTDQLGALADCDVVYIAPDVPTDDAGKSDLTDILRQINAVTAAMSADSILVILCQVPPGFTRNLGVMPPERVYYQVETLVFGRAVERATEPERYIVGCANPGIELDSRFAAILGAFGCPILTMRYESAELAKISINMCLVGSVTIANTLAELCEAIGADWSEIVPALKLDRRIGQFSYLAPGLGIAGGNLERDLATVEQLSAQHGTESSIVRAWINNSLYCKEWAARTIRRVLLDAKPDAKIAIWGLAYKENTHSTKNSPSLATITKLAGAKMRAYDPAVPDAAVRHLEIERVKDPIEAVRGVDALMILTPWPEFKTIAPDDLVSVMAGRIVIDPYSILDARKADRAGLIQFVLGRATSNPMGN